MRRPLAALLVAVALPLAACSDSTEPEENRVAGTYTLRTINGSALPFTLASNSTGSDRVEIVSGEITLSEDLTYAEERVVRNTEAGVESLDPLQFDGTYARIGTDLQITSDGLLYVLTLDDGAITERAGGLTIVWTK